MGNLQIKVLNWFLFGKRSGKAFLPVSESIRKTDIIFKVSAGGQLFEIPENLICLACQAFSLWHCHGWDLMSWPFQNPWKPDLPCLSGFLLVTLSWVGSRELAFSKPLKTWSALPVRFSPSWPCHGWDLVCRLPAIYHLRHQGSPSEPPKKPWTVYKWMSMVAFL